MKPRIKAIKTYIIQSLALSMVATLWMLYIDAKLYGTERFFKVILSITLFVFLICFIECIIKKFLEPYFIVSVCVEFLVLVGLFYILGLCLEWIRPEEKWMVFIYVIPVYIVGYALRLIGIKKEAEDINHYLKERENKIQIKDPKL